MVEDNILFTNHLQENRKFQWRSWSATIPSVGKSPQISHLQTELNYLNLFKTYCIFSDLGGPPLGVDMDGWVEVWIGEGIE